MKKDIDKVLKLSENELKTALPPLMERVKKFGVENLMKAMPDLVSRLVNNLKSIDVGKFVAEAPEASVAFMDVLWEGIGILVEKDAETKGKVVNAGEIKLNFEATDSPLKGNIKLSGGKISGGLALLDAPDLKVSSDTKTLIALLTGDVDPVRGYMSGQYKMEGSLAVGIKLAPVMQSLPKLFKA
ncbi:MAG: SCP-2 sterol transfer family protein [Candidatus Bathyarchaeota archaeon BA2]|nr:MAG: SCP-2 sterol transfer family protein [Candidatus Bathyarchaeota archaeon BA2]